MLYLVSGTPAVDFERELASDVAFYRGHTFADNTKKAYNTHLRIYLSFCERLNILPVPVSDNTIAMYAAFLAKTRKPATVKQYLNIVRLLHIEAGLPHPYQDSWVVKSTLRGIDRVKGCEVNRKTPMTPELLLTIKSKLSTSSADCVFWAASLVLFFGLLRKSNLFPDSKPFDPEKQLTRDSFRIDAASLDMIFEIRWSKTIQNKDRTLVLRLPCLKPHPLCPVSAVVQAFRCSPVAEPKSQAFPMTAQAFNAKLKKLVGPNFSSHSFRRGGATWGLTCGIPGEVIKIMGDWRSNVYMSYLDQLPQSVLNHYRHVFAKQLPSE